MPGTLVPHAEMAVGCLVLRLNAAYARWTRQWPNPFHYLSGIASAGRCSRSGWQPLRERAAAFLYAMGLEGIVSKRLGSRKEQKKLAREQSSPSTQMNGRFGLRLRQNGRSSRISQSMA